jgi:hypothetical protein
VGHDAETRRIGPHRDVALALERWGTPGPGHTHTHPPVEENHCTKAGTQEHEARHDARLMARQRVEGCPSVRRTKVQQDAKLPRAPGVTDWGGHGAGSPQVRHGTSAVHGNTAVHDTLPLEGSRSGMKTGERCDVRERQGCGSSHVGSAV